MKREEAPPFRAGEDVTETEPWSEAEERDALHAYDVARQVANKVWAKRRKANLEAAAADCAWWKALEEIDRAWLAVFHAHRKKR